MLGVSEYVMPMIGGAGGTAFGADVLNGRYLEGARRQGGIAGFVHPYNAIPTSPSQAANTEIPVNVALGQGDFYDVACIFSDELASAHMYHRILNSGFRLAATGGSDGKGPGEEILLSGNERGVVDVRVQALSIAPLSKLEIYVNGRVVEVFDATGDSTRFDVTTRVDVSTGGWVAAQVVGPPHRFLGDSYAFAHTTPVYVVRDGVAFKSEEDAMFLADAVERLWERVDARDRWSSQAGRAAYREATRRAAARYREAPGTTRR